MQVETSSGKFRWGELDRHGAASPRRSLVPSLFSLTFPPSVFSSSTTTNRKSSRTPPSARGAICRNYFTSHVWAELYPHVGGDYYRPVFLLWFRLNHAMFGVNPEGWHLTTVLCHVAATYLVFRLVRRLAASPWIAFSAATLFALHPVHIESVAWVSGVTDPLLAIFLLGSFLAYLQFREGNRWGWMGSGTGIFRPGTARERDGRRFGPPGFLVCVALRGGACLGFPGSRWL